MAITVSHKYDEYTIANPSPWVTASSIAFQNNKLYTVAVLSLSDESNFSSITGGGITWVKITSASLADATNFIGGALFRGLVTSGASTGTLSISMDISSTVMFLSIEEWDGMDTSGTNGSGAIVQGNANSGVAQTSSSVTLSAFGSSANVAYSYTGHANGSGAFTPDASNGGYTELVDFTNAGVDGQFQTQWNTGSDTNVTTSWTPITTYLGGAIEIKAASANPPAGPIAGAGWRRPVKWERGSRLWMPTGASTISLTHTVDAEIVAVPPLFQPFKSTYKSTSLRRALTSRAFGVPIPVITGLTYTVDAVIAGDIPILAPTKPIYKTTSLPRALLSRVLGVPLPRVTSLSHTVDATISSRVTRSYTVTASILRTGSRTHTVDAYIYVFGALPPAVVFVPTGTVWVAPVGTPGPTAVDDTLNAAFQEMGYVSEAGINIVQDREAYRKSSWNSLYPKEFTVVKQDIEVGFALREWSKHVVEFALEGTVAGSYTHTPPNATRTPAKALVIDAVDGDQRMRLYFPSGLVTADTESRLTRTSSADLPLIFGSDNLASPFTLYVDNEGT